MKKGLLIGYGRFGKILFEKLQSLEEIKVTVATRDYREKLSGNDWAVIATPVATHADIARDCLKAGLNVFAEKPLSEDPAEAEKIIKLAEEKNKKIYIDDVFRYRKEFLELKSVKPIHSIDFIFRKYGTFRDTLLAAHVYHDLYLLVDLLGFGKVENMIITKKEAPLEKDRIDILEFSFKYNGVPVTGSYDRTQKEKNKKIIINKNIVWHNGSIIRDGKEANIPERDALTEMLKKVLAQEVDFAYNNALALEATRLMAEIELIEK